MNSNRASNSRQQSNTNPITGHDMISTRNKKTNNTVRPPGVPSLNLGRLADNDGDERGVPLEIDPYYYNTKTPNSATSSLSWGTPSSAIIHPYVLQKAKQRENEKLKKENIKVIPENLQSAPENYKKLYKQYATDMKDEYKKQSSTHKHFITDEEVESEIERLKVTLLDPDAESDLTKDMVQKQWTNQPYSKAQLSKRADLDEFEDEKRKLKLIETVMIDQLSRAVICDPEQNDILKSRPKDFQIGMKKGASRALHNSKVSTSGTLTENLLTQKISFGVRIFTCNGKDSIRELTGFFFGLDHTITVYEFKVFGKSSKALPFLKRGIYSHKKGPRKGEPYTALDIVEGNILYFDTSQQTLPQTFRETSVIVMKIGRVDNSSKEHLMQNVPSITDEEIELKRLLYKIQKLSQSQIKKRGIRVFTGLYQKCSSLDEQNDGKLNRYDLEKSLLEFKIELPQDLLDDLWEYLDDKNDGFYDYRQYLMHVLGGMNEDRHKFVRKAWKNMDSGHNGLMQINILARFFHATKHPLVVDKKRTEEECLKEFLSSFDKGSQKGYVTFPEFEVYYEGLSACIDDDHNFIHIMSNSWGV